MNKLWIKFITATVVLFASGAVQAGPLQLTSEPLFLNQNVPPAIAVTFDDSGSMAWSWMPDSRSFNSNRRSFASPDYNALAYNPAFTYLPPLKADGTPFPDANFTAAWRDGFRPSRGTRNLSNGYRVTRYYYTYSGGGSNEKFARAGYSNTSGRPAFYYRWTCGGTPNRDSDGCYQRIIVGPAEQQNFANWYSYYRNRNMLAKTAVSRAFAGFGTDFKITWQQLNALTTFTPFQRFDGAHRNAFFNWLFFVPDSGWTPLREATVRAGKLFKKGSSYQDPAYGGELTCQQNFHIAISDGSWNGNTGVGSNYDNQAKTLPDGTAYSPGTGEMRLYRDSNSDTLADVAFFYWANDLRPTANNVPTYLKDFTDSNGNTVTVPQGDDPWTYPGIYWNPKNDPATWQHMVNFNVGLGIQGNLPVPGALPGLRDGSINWPGTGSSAGRVDDVWHASLNSRGNYFSARNPQQLSDALSQVVNAIIERRSSASASVVSTSIVTAATAVFRGAFDTSDWSGSLIAQHVNQDGTYGSILWDAACKLTGGFCPATSTTVAQTRTPATRQIYVFDKWQNTTVPFRIADISSNLLSKVSDLDLVSNGNATASDVIDYLRGDQSREIKNGGVFRNRRVVLGDIINSSAKLVRGPSSTYEDDNFPAGTPEATAAASGNGYEDFKTANQNRTNMIYVGANDGMLHAFNAEIGSGSDGDEMWAFIPSKAAENLNELPKPDYEHRSYVDATPTVRDAFINNSWSTVLIDGQRYGGQSFFALDVTNGSATQPSFLWEFTDEDDPDLGYTYGEAAIARVKSGDRWVALLPNGYNSSVADDDTGSGAAVLYVVDLETGALIRKFNTGIGSAGQPNGMATPVVSDIWNNATQQPGIDHIAEFAYAGDLYGNLWRFDLQDDDPANWTMTRLIKDDGPYERPITTQPRLFASNQPGQYDVLVTFGTGKYIELPDRTIFGVDTQYVVGVRDRVNDPSFKDLDISDSGFVQQTANTSGANKRVLTDNPVPPTAYGWKLPLPQPGERMVSRMLRDSFRRELLFITTIPNGDDPCQPGGESWIMNVDAETGGKPRTRKFRNNSADGILVNDIVVGASVLGFGGGGVEQFIIDVSGDDPTSGGNTPLTETVDDFAWRRRSWHNVLIDQ